MATKNYYVGPQDGWTKVIDSGAAFSVRISGYPHTHPFYVFGDPSATPTAADTGVLVCHKPFHVENSTVDGNTDAFWIRLVNPVPNSNKRDGRQRIDVYVDGGTLV